MSDIFKMSELHCQKVCLYLTWHFSRCDHGETLCPLAMLHLRSCDLQFALYSTVSSVNDTAVLQIEGVM